MCFDLASGVRRLYQQVGLDDAVFARSREVFVRALEGGKQPTRNAMYEVLETANISTAGGRGLHVLSQLAQEGLICFGAREGKQHTFALLDEWAPNAKRMERNEALAELALRCNWEQIGNRSMTEHLRRGLVRLINKNLKSSYPRQH